MVPAIGGSIVGFIAAILLVFGISFIGAYETQQKIIPLVHGSPNKFAITKKDALCLKQNIHYEADGEPFRGKVAVAMVTLNRRNLTNKSVCEIVFEPWQFSWTTAKKKWLTNFSDDVNFAAEVAVKGNNLIEELKTATYFHEAYTYPAWASEKRKITSIGNHIFYSEK